MAGLWPPGPASSAPVRANTEEHTKVRKNAPMATPPPVLLAILICDTIIDDKITNKKSLIGLFNQVAAREVPVRHAGLHLFVSLTDGRGMAEGEIRVVRSDTEAVVANLSGPIEFPNPMAVVELDFGIHDLLFPVAGEYRFQFYCNGELLGERKFAVVVSPEPGGEQG